MKFKLITHLLLGYELFLLKEKSVHIIFKPLCNVSKNVMAAS